MSKLERFQHAGPDEGDAMTPETRRILVDMLETIEEVQREAPTDGPNDAENHERIASRVTALREVLGSTEALRAATPRVVRTCRAVWEDLEPSGPGRPPTLPAGTYGVCLEPLHGDFDAVDFGPPWGVQHLGNHVLVDAAAVLGNARRSIVQLKRPWRAVMRRTLRTMAGPYLRVVAARYGFHDEQREDHTPGSPTFAVEAWLYAEGSRKTALKMLDEAAKIARGEQGRHRDMSTETTDYAFLTAAMKALCSAHSSSDAEAAILAHLLDANDFTSKDPHEVVATALVAQIKGYTQTENDRAACVLALDALGVSEDAIAAEMESEDP